jgi:hypothetical protein
MASGLHYCIFDLETNRIFDNNAINKPDPVIKAEVQKLSIKKKRNKTRPDPDNVKRNKTRPDPDNVKRNNARPDPQGLHKRQ